MKILSETSAGQQSWVYVIFSSLKACMY